jgi:hypothetical protein
MPFQGRSVDICQSTCVAREQSLNNWQGSSILAIARTDWPSTRRFALTTIGIVAKIAAPNSNGTAAGGLNLIATLNTALNASDFDLR